MATGRSFIPSQLSHGKCGVDEERVTHSPSGPRTLRERVPCLALPWSSPSITAMTLC